jgi:cofilin
MSRSGIGLAEEVTQYFQELKLGKKHAYVLYKISDDNRSIVVEKRGEKDALKKPEAQYEEFVNSLPSDQCRYAIYDFTYDLPNGEGTRNKIIFFAWSPDTAKVKNKMIYASSKEALRRALTGVPTEIQGTEFSEINFDAVLEKCGVKKTTVS